MDSRLFSRKWQERLELIRECQSTSRSKKNDLQFALDAQIIARVLMFDQNNFCRSDAIELLEDVGNRSDLWRVKKACSDEDPLVRMTAYNLVAMFGGKAQFGFLIKKADSEHDGVARAWAYEAAYAADSERALPWLYNKWSIERDEVAELGILDCLALLGDESAINRLDVLMASDNEWVRNGARMTLEQMEEK